MKKITFLFFAVFALLISKPTAVHAQAPTPQIVLWASSPFQDSLWAIDTANWQVIRRIGPTTPSFTITGMNGLAQDPTTGQVYIIMKLSAVTGRVLGTINLQTGVCTQIGNLGDQFSSITFDETGQLWGATGNGATVPETLYKINKATGVKTLVYTMGNGADGEIICYNKDDNNIYHWSGNSTMVFEKFPTSNVTYTPTNIPIIGTTTGETFGAAYLGTNKFLISNISSSFNRVSAGGNWSPAFGSNPDDLRGLVIPPTFTYSTDSLCLGTTYFVGAGALHLFENVIYHWGDGHTDTTGLTGASHVYTTAGTYTVAIELASGSIAQHDTFATQTIVVMPLPTPTITGATVLCAGSSFTAHATSGNANQWYLNGVAISGETSDSLLITAGGVYNVYQTTAFGCSDSAAVALTVVDVPNPVVDLGVDTAVCGSITLDAGNAGSTYVWCNSATTQTIVLSATGTCEVVVTDANGCVGTDTINVTVNPIPVVNIGNDTTVCGSIFLDAGNAGATYEWCDGSTGQTVVLPVSGTCQVFVTDSNGCVGTDTINVIVNPNPVVDLGPDTSACGNITLDAGAGFVNYTWCDLSFAQTVTFNVSGTCMVMVTDTNGCTASDTINYVVNQNPTVTATASNFLPCLDDADVLLSGTPSGGSFSGPGVTGSNFDPSVGAGMQAITYTYTDSNGCLGFAGLTINVDACASVQEQANLSVINVYPNPSSGVFNLQLNDAAVVEIFNAAGQLVGTYNYAVAGMYALDATNWAAGMYSLRAVTGNTVAQVRLVVTK